MTIRLFGLTGGVASGKSTVAERFRARGMEVIDADLVAREVVEPGSDGLNEVVLTFGNEVLAADGSLDRKRLGAIVFGDPAARARLNGILHPRIRERTMELAAELERRGVELACYEAALLVENGLADAFRPVVVVAAPHELQRARIVARDGLSEAEADARIASQLPLEDKIAVADFVIHNVGGVDELRAEADRVLDAIVARHAESAR
jgi:dephospho-CoA kinase